MHQCLPCSRRVCADSAAQANKFGAPLEEACSHFYTRIPHVFGMKRPPLIRTVAEVKEKLELLEVRP